MKSLCYCVIGWLIFNVVYTALSPDVQYIDVIHNGTKITAMVLNEANEIWDSIYYTFNAGILLAFPLYMLHEVFNKHLRIVLKVFLSYVVIKLIYEILLICGVIKITYHDNIYVVISSLIILIMFKILTNHDKGKKI